jgi:hypothetical protein
MIGHPCINDPYRTNNSMKMRPRGRFNLHPLVHFAPLRVRVPECSCIPAICSRDCDPPIVPVLTLSKTGSDQFIPRSRRRVGHLMDLGGIHGMGAGPVCRPYSPIDLAPADEPSPPINPAFP